MHRLSRFLSVVSLTSSTLAVCLNYYWIPSLGYEGTVFVSSVAVVLAIGSGLLSLILAAIILARKQPPKPIITTAISLVSIAIALAYIWSI